MKLSHSILCLTGLFFMLAGCGGESTPTSPPTSQNSGSEQVAPPSSPTVQEEDPKARITEVLESYYQDLASEQLDESKYFASTLDRFFSSRDVARETVASSIRKGFETIESRSIELDPASISVSPNGDGFVADFKGTSRVTKNGESPSPPQAFHNRVSFNKEFLITSYEAAPSQATQSRQLAPNDGGSGPSIEAVAKVLLPEFRTARFARTLQHIHPEKGYYLLTHPGAVSVPVHFQKIEDLFGQAPWLQKGMTSLSPTTTVGPLPEFDCGDMFSKEGSFLNECPPYGEISELMATLSAYELGSYEQDQIDQAKDLEQYITHALIDTEEAIGFYFGQIEGQWYLLVIDIATYDCSA